MITLTIIFTILWSTANTSERSESGEEGADIPGYENSDLNYVFI